ncbi:MAG: class I SAM-dependent methyltransferase [Terracidiphilus sp.]|jgi:SAM-dependent methyltransferase
MSVCFLCGKDMVPRFKTRDHLRPENSTEYSLAWCAGCGFGRIAGEFTPGQVAAFYTEGYYTHVSPDDLKHSSMRLLDRLRVHMAWRTDRGVDLSPGEVVRSKPGPVLCDVGCGSGQAMSAFKEAGYDAVGIEPDPAARALASRIGEVCEGTAEALPEAIAGREFDVVLLSHVLEHCIDPAAALRNVRRLLAPDGTAIIEVPNNAALGFEMYGPGWFFADIPRHLQFFTEHSLRKALGQAGLRVTRVIHTGYTRQFALQWLAAQKAIREHTGLDRDGAWDENAWSLLAKTAFARAARKYDSIRVHSVHEGGNAI